MSLIKKIFRFGTPKTGYSVPDGSWWRIQDPWPGAWQQDVKVDESTVAAYWAVFSCVTLIASDIAKMPVHVMQLVDGIYQKTQLRPVLRQPNHYQTRVEFFYNWTVSKLLHGNTYVLKERDENRRVIAMYILDPCRVTPLITNDGDVYYQLSQDNLSGINNTVTVPSSEIIHDRMYAIYHPLIGVSPIYACGISAMQGKAIQNNSSRFFSNMSMPSGVLTAPGPINPDNAKRLKEAWEANYSGKNMGKIALLGDGLKYEQVAFNAADSQLIEQLKMTAEMICACFHVPGHKVGVGQLPTVNNTATLNQQYYDQCLQFPIETMEARLDEGLELEQPYECWFDTNALLRMDPESRRKSHSEAIKGGWYAPNEARREEDLPAMPGGDTPYMQQQNFSLEALARRDEGSFKAAPEPKKKPEEVAIELSAAWMTKAAEEFRRVV